MLERAKLLPLVQLAAPGPFLGAAQAQEARDSRHGSASPRPRTPPREELGSTGLGGGLAIPHARLREVSRPVGVLAILERPIDFEAIDDLPVGLVCLLALPDSADALNALATISRYFRQPDMISRLRKARSPGEAHDLLVGSGT